jgi:uncharacterized protein YdeI (YjbR/CyaY-like superfamily)
VPRAAGEKGLLAVFEKLSYVYRKSMAAGLTGAKKEETRKNRAAEAIVMLRRDVKAS